VRTSRDIAITALGKKKWEYTCRLFEVNSLKKEAM
jgi:hypothetical protein